jgi:hypothetical protein
VRLGGDALGAEPPLQQLPRLGCGQQVDPQRVGAVRRDQPGQLVAAGDQHERAEAAGK